MNPETLECRITLSIVGIGPLTAYVGIGALVIEPLLQGSLSGVAQAIAMQEGAHRLVSLCPWCGADICGAGKPTPKYY